MVIYSLLKQINGKQQMVLEQLAIHMQKNEPRPKPHTLYKDKLRIDLNAKHPEENRREKFCNLELSRVLLAMTLQIKTVTDISNDEYEP